MTSPYQFILIVLFATTAGWLTLRLTLYFLLNPQQPVSLAGIRIQGILPKYQSSLANTLADLFSRKFLGSEELKETVVSPGVFQKLKPGIESEIDLFLREKLKVHFPMLSMLIGDKTINQLKLAFMTELEILFPKIMQTYLGNLANDDTIKKLVAKKISAISLAQFPSDKNKTFKKLFIRLQVMGALVGFILGLLEALVFMLLS